MDFYLLMKNRGKVNIDTAYYLYNNSASIISTINSNNNYCNNKLQNEDINHIIIGRWYYGLFLIAKDYLINNLNYIANCREKNKCKFYDMQNNTSCIAQCLKHKGYTSKKYNIHIESIWNILANMSSIKNKKLFGSNGKELAKLREKYEYFGVVCNFNTLKIAKSYFENIRKGYKNAKII